MPGSTTRWPAWPEWRDLLARSWREASDDNVGFLAAGVAFYAFLAVVPLLASAVLSYGLFADPATVARHIRKLFEILPSDAAAVIGDQLRNMTATPDDSKGVGLAVAIAVAVYGASKGAGAIVTALNIAYEVKETRGFLRTTLVALAITLGGLVVLAIAVVAVAVTGWIAQIFPGLPGTIHFLLQASLWTSAMIVSATGIALVYRYAPDRPEARWAWITPGSAAATLVWLIASLGFGVYASRFGHYNATYGSLGGVIVFLTWLYLTAYILLLGGELNAELEAGQSGAAAKGAEPASVRPAGPLPSAAFAPSPPASRPGPFERREKAAASSRRMAGAALFLAGLWLGYRSGRARRPRAS